MGYLHGSEGAVDLELRKLSRLTAGPLDFDVHGVVERAIAAVEVDPVGVFVADEVVGRLHRVERPPRDRKDWESVLDCVKRPVGSACEPAPVEMKPMDLSRRRELPEASDTAPEPARFHPGRKLPVSKSPLTKAFSERFFRSSIMGRGDQRLGSSLFPIGPVFGSFPGARVSANAAPLAFSFSLIDDHAACWPLNCLATKVPTSC